MILEYFACTFNKEDYEVLEGKYEDLIGENRLVKWFTDRPPYGFDIIELDFPVALFSLGSDKRSMIIEAIAKTLKIQAFFDRRYKMIIAFKAKNAISNEFRSIYGNPTKMLVKEILEKENSILKSKILTDLINSNLTNHLFNEKCSLFAIPLAIIRRSEGICNVGLDQMPYTYISKSVEGNARIMSYVFDCKPRNYTIDSGGDTLFNETKNSMLDAIEKINKTVWV
jgi:hypothetical protein